jgi:hypothetical protein
MYNARRRWRLPPRLIRGRFSTEVPEVKWEGSRPLKATHWRAVQEICIAADVRRYTDLGTVPKSPDEQSVPRAVLITIPKWEERSCECYRSSTGFRLPLLSTTTNRHLRTQLVKMCSIHTYSRQPNGGIGGRAIQNCPP